MKKFFTLKFVLVCISLCISLNARTQTDIYQNYLSNEGVFVKTDAPSLSQGEVRFPAEFEPVQAVMVVYPLNVPYQLLQEISEDCKLITVVNTRKDGSTAAGARQDYINNDVNINNCEFIEAGINSHWIRDFGPWCVFHGKDVAIVDNIYNCSFYNDKHEVVESPNWLSGNGRLYDDQFARTYATNNNIPLYGMEVVHTGGNMMQDGRGVGVSDDIVYKESKTFVNLSEETVNQRMKDYLGINPYHVTIDPQGDYIAHVDCWGKFLAPDKIIIAKVPSTHEQYNDYEKVASYFDTTNCCWGYPYKVYRVEVPVTNKSEIKAYNKIAPYTNSLILNNKVLVPISSLTPSSYNDAALAVYREAMPGYEIIGIDYVLSDDYGPYESGWLNTDALHCRTRDIMDFKMLFVDHRNVLFGEQAYQESYPITAKFIAYSGDNISKTKLHYSIDGGNSYTTVDMQQVDTTDEYTANITGHADGATIKYYVTGEDASGRTCVQPQFGELEPHTFTAGAASTQEPEQPAQPTLDLTKYYRIKTTIGTNDQYLTIFDHTSNVLGQYGGVGVASLDESKVGQMFKFENAGEGKYYLKSADGYYIYCQSYNVDAIDGTQKSALWGFDYESNFELQCDKGYFKVETVNGGNYVFCNATKETRATTIATWSLEEVPVSVTISADNNSVTVNESVQLNATAIGGTGNYTYSWSPATDLDKATIANPTFTPNTTGKYTFTCTVTDNGVTTTSNTVTITVNEALQDGDTSSEVVTIGDINNSVGFRNAPTNTYNSRSVTQQYYLHDSINKDKGTISAIAFHTADGDFSQNTVRNLTIYMKNTSESAFADKYMVKMDASEIVFTGSITLTPNQWITINLTNNFEYSGENILLCVHDNSGNYNDGINFKGFASTGDRCKYNHNGSNSTSPVDNQYTGTTSYTIPLIQFTFGAAGSTTPVVPEAPVVTATANGQNSIVLSWNAVDGATSYKVYSNGNVIATVTGTTHTVNNLQAGTNNCFSVSAVGEGGESTATEACATTDAVPVAPAAPTNVVVTVNGQNSITVTWDAVDGATYYIVYKDSQMFYSETGTSHTINNLTAGQEYCFAIQAYDANDLESELSETKCATTEAEQGDDDNTGGNTGGNVVTIGANGEITSSNVYPYISTYTYSTSQQIYTAAEIGKANGGTIEKIAFYLYNADVNKTVNDVKIYIKHTDKKSFASTSDWDKTVTGDHLVYKGSPNITNSVLEIPLDTTFKYNGTDNLLVCVDVNSKQNEATPYKIYKTTAYRAMYRRDNTNNYGPDNSDKYYNITATGRSESIPVISLTFEGGSDDGDDEQTTPVAPAAPANLTATATETTVTLTWDAVEGASYNVYQGENLLASVTETTYTVENLTANTSYTFSVKAVKDQLESDAATVTVTTLEPAPVAPATPTNVVATANGQNSIIVKWDAVAGAKYYYVYKDGTAWSQEYGTSSTINGLTAGTQYCFAVQAVNGDLESALSEEVCATTEAVPVAPATPTNVVATANGQNSITVTWDAVDGAKDYYVYKNGQMWANTNGATTYTEKNLAAGTECCFAIQAVNGDLESALSEEVCATTDDEEQGGDDNTGGDTSGNVVTIGGEINQNNTSRNVPTDTYNKCTISQQYYTAAEIGKDNGYITHIAFIALSATPDTGTPYPTYTERSIDIYMGNVNTIPTNTKITVADSTTKVFSSTIQFSIGGWTIIKLDEPFEYTGNILSVGVNDKTGSWENFKTNFATFTCSNPSRAFYLTRNTAYDPEKEINFNVSENVPFIKLTFAEGGEQTEDPIKLTASKSTIKADGGDIIRFTVTQGTNNVTNEAEIYINDVKIDGSTFTTKTAGSYTAYAKKGNVRSDYINFTAVYPIKLTADKTNIIANGNDKVTFTVKQNGVDVTGATSGTVIYIDEKAISNNTFSTSDVGTYLVYAIKDGIRSNGVEITAEEESKYNEDGVEGGNDNMYFNLDGSVTYNKGQENEYTLIATRRGNEAVIRQDNVKVNATGDYYWQYDEHKPHASTVLTIPEKVLFGNEWVTVTEVEHFAFDNTCDISEDGRNLYEEGNPLNNNFTSLIIPSTIKYIGTYTFAYTMENTDKIVCYAATPPALSNNTINNPFLKNTYDNVILYVPKSSVEAYKNAIGWGKPLQKDSDNYFKTIKPIETPTYNGDGSWTTLINWDEDYGFPKEGADIIINGNVVIENGTIANVGTIDIISGSLTVEEGGQLIHTNAGVTVTMEKVIEGFSKERGATNWYTISSPIYHSVDTSSVKNLLSNNYDLYRYDEPTHYWDNIKDLEDLEGPVGNWSTLDAGRGYLYANSGDVTLQFNGVANHTSASYTLTREAKDGKLLGFHLVGNPFTHNIYMSSAFDTDVTLANGYYVLTNEGAWGAKLGTDTIKPCQGILIQATEGEGTLTINKKVDPAPQTRSRSNNEFIAISIANNKYEDVAYVSFNAENPLEKVNHQNKNIPMVYIPAEDINYSIATMENDVEEIPVAFEAKTMGQYTIGAKSENCEFKEMYLLDKMTGIKTNLLLESYTFMATTTDNPERFVIKLNKNANDLDNGNFIFINNNEMIINNIEGRASLQIFDVMGRYLCNYEVTGSANISTEEFSSGVYIIRLMDDNGVKTQKVVL